VAVGVTTFVPFSTGGGLSPSSFDVQHEVLLTSEAGKNNYTIPVGSWVIDAAGESTLDIDSGSGFNPQGYGLDYSMFLRVTPPPTVADLAIGFTLNDGPVPAGWILRFRWTQRVQSIPPPVPSPILLSGGVPDYSVAWHPDNSATAPNGVVVTPTGGMKVEFWRLTKRVGGLRGLTLHRDGRRYVPYFRGAVDQTTFASTEFAPSNQKNTRRFKVLYVDAAGRRSALSDETIVVFGGGGDNGERIRNPAGAPPVYQHVLGCVWVRGSY